MNYPRILTVQDISCVGQCSLTVALPILAACGTEACILPSAVLSTHTGGFKNFTFRDLTDDIPGIQKHWESENLSFQAIYTGYLGSRKQIGFIKDLFDSVCFSNAKRIVDPAMGDGGRLYYGFDQEYANEMRILCDGADVLLPNITEACYLTGIAYKETYDEKYVTDISNGLLDLGCKNVLLTGISFEQGYTGVMCVNKNEAVYYRHEKLPKSYHGTGDIYSSAFTGAYMIGHSMAKAAKIAADYTVACIKKTVDDSAHWYGVKFETAIPELIAALHK